MFKWTRGAIMMKIDYICTVNKKFKKIKQGSIMNEHLNQMQNYYIVNSKLGKEFKLKMFERRSKNFHIFSLISKTTIIFPTVIP